MHVHTLDMLCDLKCWSWCTHHDLCCHLGFWLTQPCTHVGFFDTSAPSFGVALLMYAIEYSLHRLTEVTLQLLNCIDES